jgi:hypothetical protein
MTRLDDAVIEEIHGQGERLLVDELVELVETHHRFDHPGVPRDLVGEYLDELEGEAAFDVGPMREQLDEHLTADRSFVDANAVYEVGDEHVSSYPASWHARLDEDSSLADFVYVMTHSTGDTPGSAASEGVAKYDLFTAAAVIGGMSRNEAKDELRDLRADGVLVADADQHPRAGVSLAEDADFEKDRLDKPDWGDRSSE